MDIKELLSVAPPYITLALPLYLYYRSKVDRKEVEANKKLSAASVQKADLALQKIDEHEHECAQIRKEVLLEKIENLDEKVCAFLEDSKEFREDVKNSFLRGEAKFDKLNDFLLKQSIPGK